MKLVQPLVFAALLGVLGTGHAQLKPSGPATQPVSPSAPDVMQREAQGFKEMAARLAAENWLALLDAGDYGKAWDQCAKAFRERVTRAQWIEGVPKTRGALGAMKSRRAEVASYKPTMAGMPNGEYVTVRFSTSFAKKEEAQELVSLVFEDGIWRPLGFGIG